MVKIATWNVNSIKTRINHLVEYLKSENAPEIILLQELKCIEENFPFIEIEDLGYNIAVNGQKTYNGVAILSKFPIEDIVKNLPGDETDIQARYIEAVIPINEKAIRVASVYVPNGQSPDSDKFKYKLSFINRLNDKVNSLLEYDEIFILGGDFNIAPQLELDVYDPKNLNGSICCHPQERKKYHSLINLGLCDIYRKINNNKQQFTWWDYRSNSWNQNKGMRIDYLLLSPEAADIANDCNVEIFIRDKEKPSDHAPVWTSLQV